jgi:TatD DNase family protein
MGFMISFAGNVTFPKALQIRDAAKQVPLERMLIETDSPFLAPAALSRQTERTGFRQCNGAPIGRIARNFRPKPSESGRRNNFYGFLFASRKRRFDLVCYYRVTAAD